MQQWVVDRATGIDSSTCSPFAGGYGRQVAGVQGRRGGIDRRSEDPRRQTHDLHDVCLGRQDHPVSMQTFARPQGLSTANAVPCPRLPTPQPPHQVVLPEGSTDIKPILPYDMEHSFDVK